MATLTFYKYERLIQVDKPQTEVTIQDILNQIRDYEEMLINLDYGHIANAYGKQPLGGGTYVGITLELINNWRLCFEARDGIEEGGGTILCTVAGGNLVAINDYDNNPIYPTAFTQVVIAQSSSPTIATPPSDYSMLYLLESLRPRGKSLGSIFYWNPDPTVGDDSNDGTTPATAVATFAQAQSLCTAGANDIIFALQTTATGSTSVSETLNITTPNLKLRGPGYPFTLSGTQGSPTVTIAADNVEVSGFYVTTDSGGTDNAITVTGDNALIQDCWIDSATGNGIDISSSARSMIDTCAIENCDGYGINVGSSTSLSTIKKCILSGNAEGIELYDDTSVTDNVFENNLIYNNTTYGINIGDNTTRTVIRLHHSFSNNGSTTDDNINGTGIDTYIESSGAVSDQNIIDIVDAVWDEVISSSVHAGAGSAGKTLRDAKTKATLASLK